MRPGSWEAENIIVKLQTPVQLVPESRFGRPSNGEATMLEVKFTTSLVLRVLPRYRHASASV